MAVGLRAVSHQLSAADPCVWTLLTGLCHWALSFHSMAACFQDSRKTSAAVSSVISQLIPSHPSQQIRSGPPEIRALLIKSKSTDKDLNYL